MEYLLFWGRIIYKFMGDMFFHNIELQHLYQMIITRPLYRKPQPHVNSHRKDPLRGLLMMFFANPTGFSTNSNVSADLCRYNAYITLL